MKLKDILLILWAALLLPWLGFVVSLSEVLR